MKNSVKERTWETDFNLVWAAGCDVRKGQTLWPLAFVKKNPVRVVQTDWEGSPFEETAAGR